MAAFHQQLCSAAVFCTTQTLQLGQVRKDPVAFRAKKERGLDSLTPFVALLTQHLTPTRWFSFFYARHYK